MTYEVRFGHLHITHYNHNTGNPIHRREFAPFHLKHSVGRIAGSIVVGKIINGDDSLFKELYLSYPPTFDEFKAAADIFSQYIPSALDKVLAAHEAYMNECAEFTRKVDAAQPEWAKEYEMNQEKGKP